MHYSSILHGRILGTKLSESGAWCWHLAPEFPVARCIVPEDMIGRQVGLGYPWRGPSKCSSQNQGKELYLRKTPFKTFVGRSKWNILASSHVFLDSSKSFFMNQSTVQEWWQQPEIFLRKCRSSGMWRRPQSCPEVVLKFIPVNWVTPEFDAKDHKWFTFDHLSMQLRGGKIGCTVMVLAGLNLVLL